MKTLPALPLRVLDIGNTASSGKIFLSVGEKGKDRFGSYAALSYCWGTDTGSPMYCTTRENIEDLKKGVDVSTLPKTFTDSILICKRLGINFLWIDAMCIIQGDNGDWHEQASQMSHIYSNAILTIAAAAGDNSHAGLFVDRDPRTTYPATLNCQYTTDEGLTTTATFLSCRDLDSEKWGHLDTRGWAFQEKYLPRRTLRFSQFGMHWSCTSINASEGMPMGLQPFNNKSQYDKDIRTDTRPTTASSVDTKQRYSWWYQAIAMYSSRNFTRESDRLIALSGLAATFPDFPDDYLYGLWKSDIAHGLAWRLVHREEESSQNTDLASSSPHSWSWASKPGAHIAYGRYLPEMQEDSCLDTSTEFDSGSESSQEPLFIELLNKESNHSTTATGPGGPIAIEPLRVRSLLAQVRFESTSHWPPDPTLGSLLVTSMDMQYWPTGFRKRIKGKAFFDEQPFEGDELYILPLSLVDGSPKKPQATRGT